MYEIEYSNSFKKDYKLIKKRATGTHSDLFKS